MAKVLNPNEKITEIHKVIYEKMEGLIANLWGRWQDEKEYEDWKEYEKILRKAFLECLPLMGANAKGVSFVKAQKRPFGIVYRLDNDFFEGVDMSTWPNFAKQLSAGPAFKTVTLSCKVNGNYLTFKTDIA